MSLLAARSRNWRLRRQLGKAEDRAAQAEVRLAEIEETTAPQQALGGPK